MNKYLTILCVIFNISIAQAMDGNSKQGFLSKLAKKLKRQKEEEIAPALLKQGEELIAAIEASSRAWDEYQDAVNYQDLLFEQLKLQRTAKNINSPEVVRLVQAWEAAKTVTETKSAQYDAKRLANEETKKKISE